MQRTKKEITACSELDAIIRASTVMYLAMCQDNMPYVIPMSFGFDGENVYFHCAQQKGVKLEILCKNPRVCALFGKSATLDPQGDNPCAWGFNFETVIIQGEARRVEGEKEKQLALQLITDQYAQGLTVPRNAVARVDVWKIKVEHMTGKRS